MVGVPQAVAVNSGTSALEIALRACGLKQGDEIIVPTNTFAATAAAVVFAGGRPITDVCRDSLTLDADTVRRVITPKTRGVIVVHTGGFFCPEVESIRDECGKRDLFLIEDAAHAHGSKIKEKPAGSLGSVGCFSFYPTKNNDIWRRRNDNDAQRADC